MPHDTAERIAQDDELHERKDHRHDEQRRAAQEPAQVALDDGPHPLHGVLLAVPRNLR